MLLIVLDFVIPPTSMNPFSKKIFPFFLVFLSAFYFSSYSHSGASIISDILTASKTIVQVHALTEGLAPSHGSAAMVQVEKTGAGVIIDPSGIIVTNAHTVIGAQRIAIRTHDGRELPASLLGGSGQDDIVLLKVEAGALPFSLLADAGRLKPGDTVYSVGNSAFLNQTISEGILLGIGQRTQGPQAQPEPVLLRINFKVYPGDSGTPIFGSSGNLYGITVGNAGNTTIAVSSTQINKGYLAVKKQLGL